MALVETTTIKIAEISWDLNSVWRKFLYPLIRFRFIFLKAMADFVEQLLTIHRFTITYLIHSNSMPWDKADLVQHIVLTTNSERIIF